jgi:hypothetical protein
LLVGKIQGGAVAAFVVMAVMGVMLLKSLVRLAIREKLDHLASS